MINKNELKVGDKVFVPYDEMVEWATIEEEKALIKHDGSTLIVEWIDGNCFQPRGFPRHMALRRISHIVKEPDLSQLKEDDRVRVEVPDSSQNSFLRISLKELNFTVTVRRPLWEYDNTKFTSTETHYVIPRDWIREILPKEITIDDLELGMDVEIKDHRLKSIFRGGEPSKSKDKHRGKVFTIHEIFKDNGNYFDHISVDKENAFILVSDIARIVSRPGERKDIISKKVVTDDSDKADTNIGSKKQKDQSEINAEMIARDDEGLQKEPIVLPEPVTAPIMVAVSPFSEKHLNPNNKSMLDWSAPNWGLVGYE